MPDRKSIAFDEVTPGQYVIVLDAVWGSGQGGTVVSRTDDELVIKNPPGTEFRYPAGEFHSERRIEIEVPYAAKDCARYDPDRCLGDVDWHSAGGRGTPILRCRLHREEREEQYARSSERYAHSATAPEWFDPEYAGERWEDD